MKTLLPQVVTFVALLSLAPPAGAAKPETCGNGRVQQGEWCDTAGDSATCDADCSPVDCGDRYVNAAAAEQCDNAGESATCDADCTAPSCGDAVINRSAGEDCDDGTETARCDADCTPAACGDGHVNAAAGEQCDTEGESATCDSDCTLPMCGDSRVNPAAGEDCDGNTPAAGSCVSCALVCAGPTASCTDGTKNGAETDVDCGGGSCAPCGDGMQCVADADCLSASCVDGVCAAVQGGPSIAISPASLAFGNVVVGSSASLFVTVVNAGSASLVVSSVLVVGSAAEFTVEPSGPFTVLPQQAQNVLVRFAPTSVGTKTASLVFSSNDPSSPTTVITVFGTGI
jgi:hypothetical protein